MKVLLVCALIALAIAKPHHDIPSEIKEKWVKLIEPHQKHCVEESGVKIEQVEDAMQHNHFPNERPLKCYLNCLHLKLNVMDSNGNFDMESFKTDVADVEKLQELVKDEKDLCEKSYLFVTHAVKQIASKTV